MCANTHTKKQQRVIITGIAQGRNNMFKYSFKKSALLLSIALTFLAASEGATAASASTSVPVSASVTQGCSISTTSALAFATYDPVGTNATTALNATGQISVACSKGASGMTIGMDNGTHVSGTQRQMIGGTATNLLQYNIFQPPSSLPNTACTFAGTTAWTAIDPGLLKLTSAPTKAARVYSVCGTIPAGQDVAADTYSDTVGATINF
jgi:spore coat protein U-like protein